MKKSELRQHLKTIAQKLRRYESEKARGNLQLLESVENTTDSTLLRKWGWICTIGFSAFSFLIMPLFITIFQPMVPALIDNILWAIAKLSMGMSVIMIGTSVYFTIGLDSDNK